MAAASPAAGLCAQRGREIAGNLPIHPRVPLML